MNYLVYRFDMNTMKTSLIIILLLLTSLILINCEQGYLQRPKSVVELKMELKQQEEMSPLVYINSENVLLTPQRRKIRDEGFFHDAEYIPDGAIISGFIVNTATLAKFKDVRVKVSFYSKTQTLISQQAYIIYEYSEPNTKKHFSIKIAEVPTAYDTFNFEVTEATVVEF